MNDKKIKIGTLTLFEGNFNYGGLLQACALCKVLNDLGCDCQVLSYSDAFNPVYPSTRKLLSQYGMKEITKKMLEKMNAKIGSRNFKRILSIRTTRIYTFVDQYIPHTEHYDDKKLLEEYACYDVLISGSDQVWNPNCARKGFLQMFPHKNIRKISYAASISRNSLSEYEKAIMLPAILDFDFVAVREKTAQEILNKEGFGHVFVTIDPTLLLNGEEWNAMASHRIVDKNYVLCYFFSDSRKYREDLAKMCKEKKLELVYIPYAKQEFNRFDNRGAGKPLYDIGPAEFLSLFKYAQYVFTDSFHGTVFSLIYQKKFWVLERDKTSKTSMNSRLCDLLAEVNLSDRLIANVSNTMGLGDGVNYESVNGIISSLQRDSLEYLKKATGINK